MKTLVVLIALVATIHTKPNLVLTPYHHPTTSILRNIWAPSHYIIPSYQAIPSLPTLNAATHEKSATCVNNLNEAVPCAHTSIDDANTRAIGGLTSSNYDTEFNDENKAILKNKGLRNIKLVRDKSTSTVTETIEWTQISRCWWGCKEDYEFGFYYEEGNKNKRFMVFVHDETNIPDSFSTNGYKGKLHFGVLPEVSSKGGSVFFVIHPNEFGPYRHQFISSIVDEGLLGGALGAAIGVILGPAGVLVGPVLADDYTGKFLRYIG